VLFAPFMPNKVQAVWTQLGAPGRVDAQRFDTLSSLEPSGWRVAKGEALFPRPVAAPNASA
jgi:methionyl-tRNA synthetase